MSPFSDEDRKRANRADRARGKRITAFGRACLACGQYVRIGELRNHGKECIYCQVPDFPPTTERQPS